MRRTKHVEELIEDDEQKPDFDDMMNEVQEEIEEHDAEDAVVSRAPELRQLSEDIDKATNTWINATLQLESASTIRLKPLLAMPLTLSVVRLTPSTPTSTMF